MSENVVIPVPDAWARKAYVDDVAYRGKHAAALADPEAFWGVEGQRLDWMKPYTKVKDVSFRRGGLPHPLVRGRRSQRRLQLHRSALGEARRPSRFDLGRRRAV